MRARLINISRLIRFATEFEEAANTLRSIDLPPFGNSKTEIGLELAKPASPNPEVLSQKLEDFAIGFADLNEEIKNIIELANVTSKLALQKSRDTKDNITNLVGYVTFLDNKMDVLADFMKKIRNYVDAWYLPKEEHFISADPLTEEDFEESYHTKRSND